MGISFYEDYKNFIPGKQSQRTFNLVLTTTYIRYSTCFNLNQTSLSTF